MVTRCPDSWPHDATRRACETDAIGPSKDPLAALPVTSPRTGRTYRSAACARCHGDTDGAVLWSTLLRCPVTGPGEAENITAASLRQNEDGIWGVMVTANGSESFRPCQLELQLPRSLGDEHVRGCLPAVSECAPDWVGPETAVQCGAYTGRVLDLSRANRRAEPFGHVYRNLHCALCNGVPADVLVCGRLSRFRGGGVAYASPPYPSSLPFSILLDISDRSGSGTVGAVTVCDDGRLWDPFFHKCRHIFCDDGYTLKDDTCVPEVELPDDDGAESSQFKLCPKFYLTADEFENRSDGSVYVQLYDQRYAEEEFELRDGELVVCSKSGDFSKFDAALGTLSLVFVVVSIVCLCCHLALFCLVPEQRNLPGKNLAALCACLLAGYICFVAAPFQEPASEGCRALGVLMYAAFMASFFWMNVMAFDVFISLRYEQNMHNTS
ncbi:putative G-protein coupled receptor Mth-like 4 [Amphibalanus amphitrite]|uniref:Putative G-protein coupled receptor Mth-like 4 n=1 Tax=Amphibalanus amphitrite TaxID=1232801 RepID=A0A6A4WT62_AMPAM|nr:putative G-protein coupled receptor Mth-like 4 [Amphibalanus amphitrite]